MNIHWKDWCWSWSSNTLATWGEAPACYKRPWCWERLKAGEGDDRGWDGWMASLTQWTWVWASPGRWWRTGKPGVLQSMGSQRIKHDLVTDQQQTHRTQWLTGSKGCGRRSIWSEAQVQAHMSGLRRLLQEVVLGQVIERFHNQRRQGKPP